MRGSTAKLKKAMPARHKDPAEQQELCIYGLQKIDGELVQTAGQNQAAPAHK